MGWQCVPQVLGLVHGDGMRRNGKGQAKHRANAAAIIHEAFLIKDPKTGKPVRARKSASDTYDRERTKNNKYSGLMAADDVLSALEDEADSQRVTVRTTDKETGEVVIRKRALPSTTVFGIAVIFNPPGEIAKDWTPEQYDKFFRDCEESMALIPFGKIDKKTGEIIGEEHYLFRKENIVADVEHWDEGEQFPSDVVYTGHKHNIYKPEDQDGKYYGMLVDSYNLSCKVNRMFAGLMRKRGWDIDDPDYTEWDDFDTDAAYRAKRKSKIREGGKAVNNYRADKRLKEATEQLSEAQATVEQAAALGQSVKEQAQAEAEAMLTDAAEDAGNAIAQAQAEAELDALAAQDTMQLEAEIEAAALLAEARSDADSIRTAAQGEATEAKQERDQAYQQRQLIQMGIEGLTDIKNSLKEDVTGLESKVKDAKLVISQAEDAKADRDAARSDADTARTEKVRLEAEIKDAREELAAITKDKNATMNDWSDNQVRIQVQAQEFMAVKAERTDLESKIKELKEQADKIIEDAKRTAAEIVEKAKGEYAFLLKWLADQKYSSGVTFLQRAREAYQKETRKRRDAEMPARVRDAGKRRPEQDGPEKA